MNILSHHCPLTAMPISALIEQGRKDYFVIKAGDNIALKGLKHTGNYTRQAVIVVALCIMTLVSPLFLLADAVVHVLRKIGCKLKKMHKDDFHFLFTSPIFTNFINKLQVNINESLKARSELLLAYPNGPFSHPLQKKTIELINLITHAQTSLNEKANRNTHEQIIDKLRALIDDKKALVGPQIDAGVTQSIDLIESLSEFIYVGTNLMPEFTQFIEDQLPADAKDELNKLAPRAIPGWIKKWHTQLGGLVKFNGLLEYPRLYDPRRLGDVPTVLYNYPLAGRQIKVIRTPAVIKDSNRDKAGNIDKAEIVNEFRGFLDSYRKQGKVHLYINLMERYGNSEATRSSVIENLEKEYPDTLRVISLAKNSQFYLQTKKFGVSNQSYSTFKQNFLQEMFGSSKTYSWSTALGKDWQIKCSTALDNVHRQYFNKRSMLNVQERKDFIEIVYTDFIESAMKTVSPDSCNISCKSCIDRAAALLAQQFIKNCKNAGKGVDSIQRKQIAAIALAPAILAQNRVMQTDRMDRLKSAAERMIA